MNWRRGLRVIKWSIFSLVFLFLSLLVTVSVIVATEPGSRFFLQQASRFLPLELGQIRGNLLEGLDLAYLEFRIEENGQLQQRYRAENLSFRWRPAALLYSAVSVQSLKAENLLLVLPASSEEAQPAPSPWPSFALPVRIELGELHLRDLRIEQLDAEGKAQPLTRFQRLSGSLSLGTFNFRLSDLALVADDYTLIANGRIGLRYPYDANVELSWQYELNAADNPPLLFSGQASVQGDVQALAIEHQLTAPMKIRTQGQLLSNLSRPPAAIASLASPGLRLASEWPLQPLVSQWVPAGLSKDTPPSLAGSLLVSGWLDAYQVHLNTQVQTPDLPALRVDAQVRGNLQQIDVDLLRALVEEDADTPGELELAGRVAWAPALAWDLAVDIKGLDPALFLPQWPGHVSAKGRTQGNLMEEDLRFSLEGLDVGGELRGLVLSAQGDLHLEQGQLNSPGMLLALGANKLEFKGRTSREWLEMDWKVNAPLLQQLDTRLKGALSTRGQVSGNLEQLDNLSLSLTADARDLAWEDQLSLGELQLSLTPEVEESYRLGLSLKQLSAADTLINQLTLNGEGDLTNQRLSASVDTESLGSLALVLDSNIQEHQVQARFSELDLRLPGLPRWWLLRSSPMTLSLEQMDFGELCLTTRNGERRRPSADEASERVEPEIAEEEPQTQPAEEPALCLKGQQDQKGLMLSGSAQSIPLRQARSALRPEVSLHGYLNGTFSYQQPKKGEGSARFDFSTRDGAIHHQYADDPVRIYPWDLSRLEGEWRADKLTSELVSIWPGYGEMNANIGMDTSRRQLNGKLDAHFSDLTPLGVLIPMAEDLKGQLVADLNLSGPVDKPQLDGELLLQNGSAAVPYLGLSLEDVKVRLSSDGKGRMELDSRFHSGGGHLSLTGLLEDFGSDQWQLEAAMDGENFQVVDQTQIKARVSPAIRLKASAQETRLTGEALIPYAQVDIKTLPASATQVSDDVVIEEEAHKSASAAQQNRFFMNVTAVLGDEVRLNGFGLTSRLSGRMQVIKTPERALLTTGYVGVAEGKYKAYGQELTISRGQLVFQGPYDNPGLDIRAQRLVRGTSDHIIGLQIGGTLQRPTSQVYADPPLANEGDAMAILLTGKPLSEASAGDAYVIISAMSGLNMDGEGGVTGKIANAFHLDELTINAEDGLEQSELWVGKQLTERLFIRYVVSLFEQANKLVLTYQISDRLRLEAESGLTQSADVIYKIER